jgi:hypothetical protein
MKIAQSHGGILKSAFSSHSDRYEADVNIRVESTYPVQVGNVSSDDSGLMLGTVNVTSDFYTLGVKGAKAGNAVAEVSTIYRGKMPDGTKVTLVETTNRFLWIPWLSYKLVLPDGTEIPSHDVTWGEPISES